MIPFHKWLWPPIMESMERIDSFIESIGIDTLFFMNRTKIHTYHWCNYYYTQYPVIRLITDTIWSVFAFPLQFLGAVMKVSMYRRIEPADSSVTIYHTNLSKTAQLGSRDFSRLVEVGNVKNYGDAKPFWMRVAAHMSNKKEHDDVALMGEIESAINAGKTLASLEEGRDVMILARQNPRYYIFSPESCLNNTSIFKSTRSNVEFFVVQYMNDGMKTAVQLHIPSQMMYVGNVLFRPAFVLWLLEQEPLITEYVFDRNYVLTIMDQNIEEIHLSSEQYLVLGEDDYMVKKWL